MVPLLKITKPTIMVGFVAGASVEDVVENELLSVLRNKKWTLLGPLGLGVRPVRCCRPYLEEVVSKPSDADEGFCFRCQRSVRGFPHDLLEWGCPPSQM